MRPSGLVSGNFLDRLAIPAAAADETDGAFLHLDVSHLRHGLSVRAHFPTAPEKERLGAGQRLCRRDFSDGVSERHVPEKTGHLPLGLQPCQAECKRRDKAGLCASLVSDRTPLREAVK